MKRNQNWFSTGFLSIMILAAGAASRVWAVSYTAIDLNNRKTRLFVAAFLLAVSPFLPNCGVYASIIDYGVYKVEARITGDDLHPSLTKIDSKTPGLWSTSASACVADSYGPVSASWSIRPLTANEAQVNIDMSYHVSGSSYAYSYAGETGEVHFNYHSDTPFTVNYYWDLTWDIYPHGFLDLNFFCSIREAADL